MLKTIKKSFLAVVLAVATLFALTSCVITGGGQTTTDPTLDAQAALSEFTEQVTFANTAEVTTSFNLPAAGKKGNYQIPITWTSSNEAVIAITDLVEGGTTSATHKKASVTRPAFDAEDVTVTLTAEFSLTYTKNDGTSATLKETKTYNFTVLKETSEIAGGTLADIKADAGKFYFVDNAVKPGSSSAKELAFPVEFDATVTAVLGADGAGQFTVNDGTAGIYVYSNKTTVSIGDKVHVKGDITVYYGTLQVGANIEVTVLGKSDQTIEFKPATPGSVNAMDTADGMYGGQTLNVSGTLLFGKYNNGSSDSFWLEDAQTGSQIELYYKSFTAAEKEALQAYAGKFVEMNVVTYDTYSSSAPNDHRVFAIPSTVKEATAPEVTDADKLAATVAKANAASLKDVYYNGDEFAFPAIDVAEGVNIEWSIEPAAVLVDGKLVITAAGTATLKAVVTCGTLTETVTLTINLDVEVPALDTGDFEENTPYYIVATNGNGNLHFNGTIAEGRYGGKYTAAEAVKVYVEKADNGLYIYFLDGTTKTYIVMDDKSAGGSFTTDKANATIFEYNATVDTLVVAEDSNNRAFGVGATATFDTFSAYDITGTYNWGKFIKADGTTEPEEHTHTACPTCGLCTAKDCDGTAEEKCAGHYVEPEVANKTVAELNALTTEMDAKYTVTGKVVLWGKSFTSTDVAPGQYGNFVLEGEDGSKIVVYGATATASALTFNTTTGKYTYVNPKDFLTNELTSTIAVGDTVELVVVRTSYNSNPQLNAIVTKVTKAEPEQPAHEHTACPTCGLCTAEDCDGDAAVKCQGHAPVVEPEEPEFTVTIAEFAEEFLADWNAIATSPAAKATFRADTSSTIKEVFANAAFLEKYSWLFTYLKDELTEEYPEATSSYITDALRDLPLLAEGDTAVIMVSANTRTLIRLVLEGLMNESLPDTSNYTGSFDAYVVDYSIAENQNAFLTAYQASSEVKPEEPEVPAHTHTACPECGKCTAEDCDGAEEVKCQGHEPEVPVHEHTACPTCGLCTAEDCDGAEEVKCQGHVVEPTYLTVAEVKALTSGATASVKGVVIAKGTESLLIQDETGAIMLYKANNQALFGETKVGDVVTAEGVYSPYKGLHEVANLTSLAIAETGTAPAVKELTAIDAATIESLQCQIVSIELTYVSGTVGAGQNATFKDANENNVTVRGDSKWGTVETMNLVPGTTVKVTAFVNWFNGAQLTNVSGYTFVEVLTVPAHEHTACPECGKCTAEDCDGAEEDKCQGHTLATVTKTISIQNYATANNWENGVQYATLVVDEVITATATGGSNTGKYYTSGYEWRTYQTESPVIKLTAASGYSIVSVKITYNAKNSGTLTLNSSTVTSGSVVSVGASSVTFGVGGTGTNGQVKITSIEVVYQATK